MILYQLSQSTTTAADARRALVWHQSPLTAAARRPLSMPLILLVEPQYTAKFSSTKSLGSGFSIILLKSTWMKSPHCVFMPLMMKVILHILFPYFNRTIVMCHSCNRKSHCPVHASLKVLYKLWYCFCCCISLVRCWWGIHVLIVCWTIPNSKYSWSLFHAINKTIVYYSIWVFGYLVLVSTN